MMSAGGAPSPMVGIFGKIPAMGDFLHVAAAQPPVPLLEDWIQQGMVWGDARRKRVWAEAYGGGQIHAFVYRAPKSTRAGPIVGVIKPSCDAVGRDFPLAVFARVDERTLAAEPHVLPLELGDFLEAASSVLVGVAAAPSKADAESLLVRLSPPQFSGRHASDYAVWAQTAAVGQVWNTIFRGDVEAAVCAFYIIRECLTAFRGQDAPATPLSLRLPLGFGGAAAAAFWLDVVRRLGCTMQGARTAFWSVADDGGAILVALGDAPPSSTFAEVWAPDDDSENLCDLTLPSRLSARQVFSQLPAGLGRAITTPALAVSELLEACPL
jgi:type VI secretion system protein ImpM